MENQDRILEYCPICKHYGSNGACGELEINIKSYPEKFYSKCDGKLFEKLNNIPDENYLVEKFNEEVLNKPDFEEEVTNFFYPHLHEDNLKGKAQRKINAYFNKKEKENYDFIYGWPTNNAFLNLLIKILIMISGLIIYIYLKDLW
ncbi:MAG TPA: hypothetical protein PK559_12225 [Ignavibacteriaceae bacterium]|nr:hypothetical protein [Ignavibacteriaceae bacterium]